MIEKENQSSFGYPKSPLFGAIQHEQTAFGVYIYIDKMVNCKQIFTPNFFASLFSLPSPYADLSLSSPFHV